MSDEMRTKGCTLAVLLSMGACGSSPRPSPPPGAPAQDGSAVCGSAAQVLASLKMPQTVDFYVTPGAPAVDAAAARLRRILEGYQAASKGKLVFHVLPVRTGADASAALARGVALEPVEGTSGYFFGLVFREGTAEGALRILPVDRQWSELWILAKMREVRDRAEHITHRIGVLTGHGELSLKARTLVPSTEPNPSTASMESVITGLLPSLVFVDVALRGGTSPIDDSLAGLLVTQPSTDLNETELRALDRFVMTGKPVAVFAGSANVVKGDEKMRVSLGAHGLERWLGGYGLELRRDVVLDAGGAISIPIQRSAGIEHLVLPQILHVVHLEAAAPFFAQVNDLDMPFASSLVVHRERQPHATYSILARSGAGARSETSDGVVLDLHFDPAGAAAGGTHRQLDLAASIGGALTSAFPGTSPSRTAAARVVVFASSELLGNPFGIALGEGPPKDFDPGASELSNLEELYQRESLVQVLRTFNNTLDWMIDEGVAAPCTG